MSIAVVVAEDEPLIRMEAVDFLTEAGFDVVEVPHAKGALAILEENAARFQVLFTNVNMPGGVNGLASARHTYQHWPWIGLLISSGTERPSLAEMPTGGRFLPKPYKSAQVVALIRELAGSNNR